MPQRCTPTKVLGGKARGAHAPAPCSYGKEVKVILLGSIAATSGCSVTARAGTDMHLHRAGSADCKRGICSCTGEGCLLCTCWRKGQQHLYRRCASLHTSLQSALAAAAL